MNKFNKFCFVFLVFSIFSIASVSLAQYSGSGSYGTSGSASLNPIITSINPTSGSASTTVRIYGSNFAGCDSTCLSPNSGKAQTIFVNLVDSTNSNYSIYARNLTLINSSALSFLIDPALPVGTYKLFLSGIGMPAASNVINYVITSPTTSPSTATVVGSPTLKLSYDSANKESLLTATFNVSFSAGSSNVQLSPNPGTTFINTASGSGASGNSTKAILASISNPDGAVQRATDQYGRPYYVVPANTTVNLVITLTASPLEMFAGNYVARFDKLWILNAPAVNGVGGDREISAPLNQTNSVLIVGEVSPYINSVTASQTTTGQTITVNGVRLNNSVPSNWPADYSNVTHNSNGTQMTFTTKVSDGQYPLQVNDSTTGSSNTLYLSVSGSASTQSSNPIITSITPPSGSANTTVTIHGSNFYGCDSNCSTVGGKYAQTIFVNLFSNDNTNYATYARNVTLIDNNTLSFVIDRALAAGTYKLSLSGIGLAGPSNVVNYTVTSSTSTCVSSALCAPQYCQYGGNLQKCTVTSTNCSISYTTSGSCNPISTSTPPTASCDSTAQAVVNSVGGCASINQSLYSNIYNVCCVTVTKESLLSLLNTALADGLIDSQEKANLLSALNSYLK